MKVKIKALSLAIIIVLLIAVAVFIFNKNKQSFESNETVPEKTVFDCDSLNYSRISFFNGSEDRASLSIPAFWEGNYRLKEDSNSAVFYYLAQDGSAKKMFSISKQNDNSNNDDSEVICEKNNLQFVLTVYNLNISQYRKISESFECIKNSIKCY